MDGVEIKSVRVSMSEIKIPRNLFQIWIGDRLPPLNWMKTWRDFHPSWNYKLIDNDYLSHHKFINQHLIDEYIKRCEYAGAADLMRYEILYEYGGFMPEADSICIKATDELWTQNTAYTVYENELVRPGFVSPILACEPKNDFLNGVITDLNRLRPTQLDKAWKTTGNAFLARYIETKNSRVVIFPSHYFIPQHFSGSEYKGGKVVYAKKFFGETTGAYGRLSLLQKLRRLSGKARSAYFRWRLKGDFQ